MKVKSFGRVTKKAALRRLAAIYDRMDAAYAAAAAPLGFTCDGCADNCCVSHFQHHTYVEWLYFLEGVSALDEAVRRELLERAGENVRLTREALARGEVPKVMCPVNVDGRCVLYRHRFMICRLHGVPNILIAGGRVREFPGCARCAGLHAANPRAAIMDRTPLYRDLAALELELLGSRRNHLPRVDMTLSEMLAAGPPNV